MNFNTPHVLRGTVTVALAVLMLVLVTSPRAHAAALPVTVSVPATAGDPAVGGSTGWFDSGVTLAGETVTVTATGTWAACDVGSNAGCASGPDGTPAFGTGFQPLPSSLAGTLIARVGSGPWTQIGAGPTAISGTGLLQFADNDGGYYGDNSGSVSVTIAAASSGTTVTVPATAGDPAVHGSTGWFSSGITLSGGSVTVTSSGTWDACGGGCTTDGDGSVAIGTGFYPLPSAYANALVAHVGDGPWTLAGVGPTVLTGTGLLVFANNDGGDYADNLGSLSVTITGGPPPSSVSLSAPAPVGTVATAYSSSLVASGGTAPYTYSIVSGALPAGLVLNSSTGA
ncbi:MAG: putative Ig domain-containing protein, partial [Dehalococcoidia bacterium]